MFFFAWSRSVIQLGEKKPRFQSLLCLEGRVNQVACIGLYKMTRLEKLSCDILYWLNIYDIWKFTKIESGKKKVSKIATYPTFSKLINYVQGTF